MKYLGVIYYSFCGPKGTKVFEIDADTKEEAFDVLHAERSKEHSSFNNAGCRLIEINDGEELMDRSLSWRERLTGKINEDRFTKDQ